MAVTSTKWKHRLAILLRIAEKYFHKLLAGRNVSIQPIELFCIKKGYHHATSVEQFDDTANTDQWQKEVYDLAASLAKDFQYFIVIDVGCGSGYKLVNMRGNLDTIGIEINPTFNWLLRQYPHKKWRLYDEVNPSKLMTDLVICSDVIEHIDNPDSLLEFISEITFKHLVISTPERDAISGKNDYGPPENPSHYREWNATEFKKYLERYFVVTEQHIFSDKSVTQVVICKKKIVPWANSANSISKDIKL